MTYRFGQKYIRNSYGSSNDSFPRTHQIKCQVTGFPCNDKAEPNYLAIVNFFSSQLQVASINTNGADQIRALSSYHWTHSVSPD